MVKRRSILCVLLALALLPALCLHGLAEEAAPEALVEPVDPPVAELEEFMIGEALLPGDPDAGADADATLPDDPDTRADAEATLPGDAEASADGKAALPGDLEDGADGEAWLDEEPGMVAPPAADGDAPLPKKTLGAAYWEALARVVGQAQDGDTIRLNDSILQEDTLTIERKSLTLNTKASILTTEDAYKDSIALSGGGKLVLKGNGYLINNKCAVTVGDGCALTLQLVKIVKNTRGVDNRGDFTMTDGKITENDIGVENDGSFTMTGGEITGNHLGVESAHGDTVVTVSGNAKITGNGLADVRLKQGQVVAVGGKLNSGARIGVSLASDKLPSPGAPVVVTRGLSGRGTADNFEVSGLYNQYEKRLNADGELELALPGVSARRAAPDYALLAKLEASGKRALQLSWTAADGADGYDVYFARCGKSLKLKATVGASTLGFKLKGLKRGADYKARVRAWKTVDGKKQYIDPPSPVVHAIAGGYSSRYSDAKSVWVKKSALKLAVGKGAKLKAGVRNVKRGRSALTHAKLLPYYSSNRNVATVSAKGRVKGVAPGTCVIYVMANNGARAEVKVTVK